MTILDLFKFNKKAPPRKQIEIRLEAIGGQGAHSAGKILAEAFVLELGWSGHHFSSFGSEKRGTPVTSHVRAYQDQRPVRSASPVRTPDLVIISHELLLSHHPHTWSGVGPNTDVLVHSKSKPQNLKLPKEFECRNLATVPAMDIAVKEQSYFNSGMLGATCGLLPELKPAILKNTFARYFNKLSQNEIQRNLNAFDQGLKQVQIKHFKEAQAREVLEVFTQPDLGWYNTPIGGAIVNPGNSILKDMSASRRGFTPLLNRETCVNCGYCDMVCPDFCFVWGPDSTLLGIDYHYCKGCQKCVEACPVNALEVVRENKKLTEARRVPKFPNLGEKVQSTHEWWTDTEMLTPQDIEEHESK